MPTKQATLDNATSYNDNHTKLTLISTMEKGAVLKSPGNVLKDVALPAAVINEAALDSNIAWMQKFADDHGAKLAPHGKTTMAPVLFKRQLNSGAWGITVATAVQACAAFEHGVHRILMANQLVGEPNMTIIADAISSGLEFYCFVDSVENVVQLGNFFGKRKSSLNVLIELGIEGGRCGCRTAEEVEALINAIGGQKNLNLVGIGGYEGLISSSNEIADVSAYGKRLVETVRELRNSGILKQKDPLVTASGSKWFDIIAKEFQKVGENYTPVHRPGCYVVHDHSLYAGAMKDIKTRNPSLVGELVPALEVLAYVQSVPEPGLAIVALGKRDIGTVPDLPIPLCLYSQKLGKVVVEGLKTFNIMDQHTFVQIPSSGPPVSVGDVIAFGTSHPCLTFDKWRNMLLVDDDLNIIQEIKTLF